MKLFNRRSKNVNSNLPPEVQAYAQAEHRERMGMAWLVGIVSLLISLLVLAALYFGGLWLYRKVARNDKPNTTDTTETTTEPLPETPKAETKPTPKPEATTTVPDSSSSQTTTPVQAPTTQPRTGDDGSETLVRTGPDVDL